ncbi:TIGR01212 family radical SAM protein [Peptoniphilus sp. oral taxon 386]|uniref:TIGR01212 family radical SAM protein n=1 Tax=Peptoniphilus sp. oral taxon 386 TaxID=652713 RepID=UPI0001DA9D28|nr:TIGR01212 family radical SAM protein [Peptoniphilus sp. oral taxon 386]EFI41302.1 radical SAM protein, TIGR01212 family [Peptoniphilus sp. oral taxon 386 str. F0131]
MRRFLSFNDYFKEKFNTKIAKLSLDIGSTCPNRDGTLSYRGCIFCSERGSGDFAGDRLLSIDNQINQQKYLLSKKWNATKFIAYFQNFTNTYGNIESLEKIYTYVIKRDDIIGLSIATRADCLGDDVMEMLKRLNEKTFLWLEIGMQTINENTINIINRGYSHKIFDENVKKLKNNNIKFLTHIIFGLPYETKEDMLNTVKYVKALHPFGIKFHSLYIQNYSDLYNYYLENKFDIISKDDYINLVCDSIEILPKDIVIHRLTGDADKKKLIEPKWCADKLSVISSIDKELKNRNLPIII